MRIQTKWDKGITVVLEPGEEGFPPEVFESVLRHELNDYGLDPKGNPVHCGGKNSRVYWIEVELY